MRGMTDHHPDAPIIDALGGTGAVAAAGSWPQSRVSNWRKRGIPDFASVRAVFVRLAAERQYNLPADFMSPEPKRVA